MRLDDPLHHREAYTQALAARVEPLEHVQHTLAVARVDADTLVLHQHHDAALLRLSREHAHAPALPELHRVVEQVLEHLHQPGAVSEHDRQ